MDLRPELIPPVLDEALVARLAKLAAAIDAARTGDWEDKLPIFNALAGTSFTYGDFYGIYGAENHINWVRRVLSRQRIKPAENVTREELIEVISRAYPNHPDAEIYMLIFDANVPLKLGSLLIYYPIDYGRGPKDISKYDPTPEEIVDGALRYREWLS